VSAYQANAPNFARTLADTGEIVAEEIAGLRRLVDNFRTFGQLPKVEPHPLLLREVIAELEREGVLAERLRVDAPPSPDADVTVSADKLLLKRVFANLAENAVHAGQEAGQPGDVVVGWRVDGKQVIVTVDDQGKGVAAAERERIFEPYVTTKPTGTGLGLAIAKKIALEHRGSLEIAAEPAPSGGARFVVTLPVA
jgi:signal transduction histidine kinase